MAGKKESKTARASTRAASRGGAKGGGFERSSESPLFVPLNKGNAAYVFTAAGATLRTTPGTPELAVAVAELLETKDASRVERELAALDERYPTAGWGKVLDEVRAAAGSTEAEAA